MSLDYYFQMRFVLRYNFYLQTAVCYYEFFLFSDCGLFLLLNFLFSDCGRLRRPDATDADNKVCRRGAGPHA